MDKVRAFISYSRRDIGFAQRLRTNLIETSADAYLDTFDIAAGEAWRERLSRLIERADCVVVVLTPASVASDICRWEVEHAESLTKRLIPVVLEDVDLSLVHPAIARRNFVFMRTPQEEADGLQRLCAAIEVDVAWLRAHTRYGERALEWDDAGRAPRLLLRGVDIREAENWRDARPLAAQISPIQSAYITASRRASGFRQRMWIIGSSTVAVATVVLAVVALIQRQHAVAERNLALLTESRFLANAAEKRRVEGDAAGAIELALWGLPADPKAANARPVSPEAQRVLYESVLERRETKVFRGHRGALTSVGFDADGKRVLTTSRDGFAAVWTLDGARVASLGDHGGQVHTAFANSDGHRVVTVAHNGVAALWKADGTLVANLQKQSDVAIRVAAAALGAPWFAIGGHDGSVRILDWDGSLLANLEGPVGGVSSLAVSHDGRWLAAGAGDPTGDKSVRVWEHKKDQWVLAATMRGHKSIPIRLTFSPRGDRLASSSSSDELFVWRASRTSDEVNNDASAVDEWRLAAGMRAHSTGALLTGPLAVTWSPDGARLLTGGYDDLAHVWTADGELVTTLRGHAGDVVAARFNPDGTRLLTASRDGTAVVWLASGERLLTLGGRSVPLSNADFDPKGDAIIVADESGTARHFAIVPLTYARLPSGAGPLRRLAFTLDSQRLVVAGSDPAPRIWNRVPNGTASRFEPSVWRSQPVGEAHEQINIIRGVAALAVSPTGDLAFTAGHDRTVRLHAIGSEPATGLPAPAWREHGGSVVDVAVAQDGRLAATASWDGTVRFWHATGPITRWTAGGAIRVAGSRAQRVLISSDNRVLVTQADTDREGGRSSSVEIWSFAPGTPAIRRATIELAKGAHGLDVDSAGQLIAVAGSDGTISVHSMDGIRLAERVAAHGANQPIQKVVFGRAPGSLGSVAGDRVARLWRFVRPSGSTVGALELAAELIGHEESGVMHGGLLSGVADMAFAPGNRTVATAGRDGTVRLWSPDGTPLGAFRGPGEVESVAFSHDATLVAGAWSDGIARVFPAPPPLPDLLAEAGSIVAALRPLGAQDRCAAQIQVTPCGGRHVDALGAEAAGDFAAAAAHKSADVAALARVAGRADRAIAEELGQLAHYRLLARDFAGAEDAARAGLSRQSEAIWIAGNLAHALLLQGNMLDAEKIYWTHRAAEAFPGVRWHDMVAADFEAFRKAGIESSAFDHILKELAASE
jgi:WD40 repeat protein